MARPGLDRRRVGIAALAAAFWPGVSRASLVAPDLVAPGMTVRPPVTPDAIPADIGVFTDLYRRMTAPVMIDGQGPFAFVVDTGANRSVISTELAAQLGLAIGPSQAVNGAAGVRDAPTVVAGVAVGRSEAARTVLSVLPTEAIGGAGMLGLDRLDGQRLTLDFHGRQLRIEGSRDAARDAADIVVRARRRDGQLTLVDADLGGAPITAFLDSGAQTTIGDPALRDLVRARNPKTAWTAATIFSATGQSLQAEVADVPELRIGGLRIQHLQAAFADVHIFHLWDLADRPAILLGVDVLSRFDSIALDFARGEVRFRLPLAARG